MNRKAHWESVYRTRSVTEVSWYQAEADLSLRLIREAVPDRSAPLIDVGGGASVLASRLLLAGYTHLSVLDISQAALAVARGVLGPSGGGIHWIEADILDAELPATHFQCWHDRAVFHFLTDPAARATYVAQARHALAPGGYLLLATFAEDGPTRCSGLDVVRYSPAGLAAEFGSGFSLVAAYHEMHRTPSGSPQAFSYCLFRHVPAEQPIA